MANKKKKSTGRISNGSRHQSKARQAKRGILMKIKRWERYRSNDVIAERGKHRGKGSESWDLRGLQTHLKILEKIINSPLKKP